MDHLIKLRKKYPLSTIEIVAVIFRDGLYVLCDNEETELDINKINIYKDIQQIRNLSILIRWKLCYNLFEKKDLEEIKMIGNFVSYGDIVYIYIQGTVHINYISVDIEQLIQNLNLDFKTRIYFSCFKNNIQEIIRECNDYFAGTKYNIEFDKY